MKILAAGFDMDDTLLKTDVDYHLMAMGIVDTLVEAGVPSNLLNVANGTKRNIDAGYEWMNSHLTKDEIARTERKLIKVMRDAEMANVSEATAFPGIPEVLTELRSRGFKIGVLTRGCREYAETALKNSGIYDMVDALVARDDYPEEEAKPSPKAMEHLANALGTRTDEIIYCGDFYIDWLCARDSSAKFVAVTSGTCDRAEWEEIAPGIPVIDTAADILPFFED